MNNASKEEEVIETSKEKEVVVPNTPSRKRARDEKLAGVRDEKLDVEFITLMRDYGRFDNETLAMILYGILFPNNSLMSCTPIEFYRRNVLYILGAHYHDNDIELMSKIIFTVKTWCERKWHK